jgi:hypothetical protein
MENTKAIYRCTEENVDGCGSSATEYVSFPRRLTEQEFEMFQECESMGSTPGESGISPEQIQKAEQVLIDNGIETDEAQTVLQAIGYVLLDTALYPEN